MGTPLRLRVEDPSLDVFLQTILSRFATERTPVRAKDTLSVATWEGRPTIFAGCRRLVSGPPGPVANRLLQEANHRFVTGATMFAAHAGVVGRGPIVTALAADSGGGKTTLVAALLQTGWAYGSDEALCLEDDQTVTPYPKLLGLSRWSRENLGLADPPGFEGMDEAPVQPAALGGSELAAGGRLTDLVLPELVAGASPELVPITPGEVMKTLIVNSFNHYRNPEATYRLTAKVASEVRGWRLRVGDPIDAARLLTERLVPGTAG